MSFCTFNVEIACVFSFLIERFYILVKLHGKHGLYKYLHGLSSNFQVAIVLITMVIIFIYVKWLLLMCNVLTVNKKYDRQNKKKWVAMAFSDCMGAV